MQKQLPTVSLLVALAISIAVFHACGGNEPEPQAPASGELQFLGGEDEIPATSIRLNSQSVQLVVGRSSTLRATVQPANTTDVVTWTSSDESCATVSSSGIVTAVAVGTATITATAGALTATCRVTVVPDPATVDAGVKIGNTTWATRNVGEFGRFATNFYDYGKFYQWNSSVAYPERGGVSSWNAGVSVGTVWQQANNPCPAGWRIPTLAEFEELQNAGGGVAYYYNRGSYIYGWVFYSDVQGFLFLPLSGFRANNSGELLTEDNNGYYWSTTPYNNEYAYGWLLTWDFMAKSTSTHAVGQTVRCVKE